MKNSPKDELFSCIDLQLRRIDDPLSEGRKPRTRCAILPARPVELRGRRQGKAFDRHQCAAVPVLIKTDCKSALELTQSIISGEEIDRKHNDADILSVIEYWVKEKGEDIAIEWMPAHLDEDENIRKKEVFLNSGGTE